MRPLLRIRVWLAGDGRRRFVAALALLALVVSLLAPLALQAHAAAPAAQSRATSPLPPRASPVDPKAAARRFQAQHLGKRKPAAASYLQALHQAAELPRLPLGAPQSPASASPASGSPGMKATASPPLTAWSPLGPQPINYMTPFGPQHPVPASEYTVGGTVTAIDVAPADANDVWIGTSLGGVWHTTDGGTSWTPMTDSQATMAIGSIAMDPTDPNTVYAGTGDANQIFGNDYPGLGVLKTTDRGQHWTLLDTADFAGLAIGKIAIDPANPQVIVLAAGWDGSFLGNPDKTGLWRSADGGATWTQTLSDPGQLYPDAGTDVAFNPANPNIVFAGLGNLYAQNTTTASGVYESQDAGQHWTQITALPTGTNVERVSVAVSANGSYVYAALTNGDYPGNVDFGQLLNMSLYYSADGGATWHADDMGAMLSSSLDMWFSSTLRVDAGDSTGQTAYFGAGMLFLVRAGTDSMQFWQSSPSLSSVHAIATVGGGTSSFYVGAQEGIWSGDPSVTLTSRNGAGPNGLALGQIVSGAVGTLGTTSRLYASAYPWIGAAQYPSGPLTGPAQWNLSDYDASATGSVLVDYTNNAVVYNESTGRYLAFDRSSDGGATWSQISPGTIFNKSDTADSILPFIMSPSDPDELFIATDRIYRVTKAGTTWALISPVLDPASPCASPTDSGCVPISALAVAPSNDGYIYAGDDNGNVYVTPDGGVTWRAATAPCASCGSWVTSLAVDPTNATTVYATFATYSVPGGQHVYKSTDAGTTWRDISSTLPNAPVSSVAVSPANPSLVVAGSDAGIFASEDAGATWGQLGSGLPNTLINQVFFSHTGDGLFVGTDGRGVWQFPFAHAIASPSAISATAHMGLTPAPQTLTVQNTGQAPLNWTLTAPSTLPSWLSISDASGVIVPGTSRTVAPGGSDSLTITFNVSQNAPAQTLSTMLTFSDPYADTPQISVPVTLVLTNLSKQWYFAEGYTGGSFDEYLTVANPNDVDAHITVTYLLQGGQAPIVKHYTVSAGNRFTQNVRNDVGGGQSVAMEVTSDQPIVAERPMYFTFAGIPGGSDVLGATDLSASTYYFGYVDNEIDAYTYLTILNTNANTTLYANVTYYGASEGPFHMQEAIPPLSRGTIDVKNHAVVEGYILPSTHFSAVVTLTSDPAGIHPASGGLVERPMYLASTSTHYNGSADVMGVTQPSARWDFAEGFTGSTRAPFQEWYVLSNPSATQTATATLTLMRTDGSITAPTVMLPPQTMQFFDVNSWLGGGQSNSAEVTAVQFGTSTPAPILAERVQIFDYLGDPGMTDVLGAAAPGQYFAFAEGYTGPGFTEYLTVQNPDASRTAHVQVKFLPPGGSPVTQQYSIAPHARFTLNVGSVLPGVSLALVLLSDVPVVAERPQYFAYARGQRGGTDVVGYQP